MFQYFVFLSPILSKNFIFINYKKEALSYKTLEKLRMTQVSLKSFKTVLTERVASLKDIDKKSKYILSFLLY